MVPHLQAYHKIKRQLCQWLETERITHLRNLALLIFGLQASGAIHLSLIVRQWPSRSQELSLVNRLHRGAKGHTTSDEWAKVVRMGIVDSVTLIILMVAAIVLAGIVIGMRRRR